MLNVRELFKNHVESEIDNAIEYEFRLNRDLMVINDSEEDGIFFEIPNKTFIEADFKESILKQLKQNFFSFFLPKSTVGLGHTAPCGPPSGRSSQSPLRWATPTSPSLSVSSS